MIASEQQAIAVQTRRRAAGLKGRAKAVRRWFKREHGLAVDANTSPETREIRAALSGDFTGCRGFNEVHE